MSIKFKHLTYFRVAPGFVLDRDAMEAALQQAVFAPCGDAQRSSSGWVAARDVPNSPLVEVINGEVIVRLQFEDKVLPGQVVKRRVEEMSSKIEQETGRKPGAKQKKELKEQAELELLPRAFTKKGSTTAWISPRLGLLVVDTFTSAKADFIVTQLVKAIPGFAVSAVQTASSPSGSMAAWLADGDAPYRFTVDRECELVAADEAKSGVKYNKHSLDIEEVRAHIKQGKMPKRLSMTWNGRVSFVLTDGGTLRKIEFLEGVFKDSQKSSGDEAFDADVVILAGEIGGLIPDLLEALGGEIPLGQHAAAPTDSAAAVA